MWLGVINKLAKTSVLICILSLYVKISALLISHPANPAYWTGITWFGITAVFVHSFRYTLKWWDK